MESFSERMGITKKDFLKFNEIDIGLSNRILNLILENIIREINNYYFSDSPEELVREKFEELIIVKFFKNTIYEYKLKYNYSHKGRTFFDFRKYIHEKYNTLKWYEKYNLIELLIKFFYDFDYYRSKDSAYDGKYKYFANEFVKELNNILEEEKTAYRVIDYKITPITNKLEIDEVNKALINNDDKFKTASAHIKDAIDALSQKPIGDYNNVIKCSVLALEVALKESLDIKGNIKIRNKELINKFQEKYKVNKFMTEPINQFIGILRNGKYDIMHSSFDDNKSSCMEATFKATFMEAKYALVMSCNFLNYIKSLKN